MITGVINFIYHSQVGWIETDIKSNIKLFEFCFLNGLLVVGVYRYSI